jgi:hypothetical protein
MVVTIVCSARLSCAEEGLERTRKAAPAAYRNWFFMVERLSGHPNQSQVGEQPPSDAAPDALMPTLDNLSLDNLSFVNLGSR